MLKSAYQTRPYPIYKKVGGQLVRIDKRDPNRDYGCVSGNVDGIILTYDLELTDEEQKKYNEDQAKNEAERPMREAEMKTQADLQRKRGVEFRQSLKYEVRLVVFLDILGWRSEIEKSSKNEKLAEQLGIALTLFTEMKRLNDSLKGWFGDPQVSHFSDSLVISVKFEQHVVEHLLRYLGLAVDFFLERGLLVRGGISFGLLTHIYGPALLKAYDIERDKTV